MCKVVNLSFGDQTQIMKTGLNQFQLAILVDDLSIIYPDIVFTIAVGNIPNHLITNETFPDYLCDGRSEIRLCDPSSSIHALSIGSVEEGPSGLIPSNFTRIGLGLNDMIKPELVELGGGSYKSVILLNPDFRQRPFTFSSGTSFSSPIIAHYVAQLIEKYPKYSRNLIIALLLSSAKYPENFLKPFPELNKITNNTSFQQISNVYGYGKPMLSRALMSDDNRIVFKYEGSIKLDYVQYFEITIPTDFVTEKDDRTLSVSLVFDPPTRATRADYFGTRFEFHMFRNIVIDDLKQKYSKVDLSPTDDSQEIMPEMFRSNEIKFKPASSLRKTTPHQKGIAKLTSRYKIDSSYPLTLVAICQKKWAMEDDFEQNFAIVVTLEHEQEIDLYNKLQTLNKISISASTRVRV